MIRDEGKRQFQATVDRGYTTGSPLLDQALDKGGEDLIRAGLSKTKEGVLGAYDYAKDFDVSEAKHTFDKFWGMDERAPPPIPTMEYYDPWEEGRYSHVPQRDAPTTSDWSAHKWAYHDGKLAAFSTAEAAAAAGTDALYDRDQFLYGYDWSYIDDHGRHVSRPTDRAPTESGYMRTPWFEEVDRTPVQYVPPVQVYPAFDPMQPVTPEIERTDPGEEDVDPDVSDPTRPEDPDSKTDPERPDAPTPIGGSVIMSDIIGELYGKKKKKTKSGFRYGSI